WRDPPRPHWWRVPSRRRVAESQSLAVRCGESNDEAGARRRVVTVLDVDFAAVALDDGLRDGESKARMAPEPFAFRPDRMEAVEDGFARFWRNAGPFVVDANKDLVANPGSGDLDEASRRGEADRIVDDVVDRPDQAVGLAH